MAFFSGLSSSIGKRLLLYGLRQIDILDKDPADFVSVDVGKRTTLEVRDVGLHIKKLVALLHLDLPPEVQLSKARASLLRVTLVFDFGVPQISIQVDGIQVQARIIDVEQDSADAPYAHPSVSSPTPRDDGSDIAEGDDHVPTVDELAKSFMRAEPNEGIRELQQELEAHPEYMEDSLAYGSDGDEDGSAGMGAPLALPTYLRNILNTALDRLSLAINDIDIEVEDHSIKEEAGSASPVSSSPVSLNFHIESIAIDSITAPDMYPDAASVLDTKKGKRRMHIQQICARLVSDGENFVSMSRMSHPTSPTIARTSPPVVQSEPHESHSPVAFIHEHLPEPQVHDEADTHQEDIEHEDPDVPSSLQASLASLPKDGIPSPTSSVPGSTKLAESNYTVDEDRFADAAIEDDMPDLRPENSSSPAAHQQRQDTQLSASDLLYDNDDGGVLEYAMDNGLLDSRFEDDPEAGLLLEQEGSWYSEQHNFTTQDQSYLDDSETLASNLPTVSALGRSFPQLTPQSVSTSVSDLPTVSALGRSFVPPTSAFSSLQESDSNLLTMASFPSLAVSEHNTSLEQVKASRHDTSPPQVIPEVETPPVAGDLAESQLFSHDEAESMYMSALSATPHVPGGWDSSSSSSKSYASENSASVPDDMVAGSVLNHLAQDEESCQTPRPGTPQSASSSPLAERASTPTAAPGTLRQSKLFLTIDEVTIWFPLGLEQQQPGDNPANAEVESSAFNFEPSKLGEDSIFADMPGSFSNYALSSSHRRKPSMEASVRKQAQARAQVHADRDRKDSPLSQGRQQSRSTISIDIGSIAGHMDISTGRIMHTLSDRVLSAFTGMPSESERSHKAEDSLTDSTKHIEVTIRYIGIAWLEYILAESLLGGQSASRALSLNPPGAILRIGLGGLHLSSRLRAAESKAKLQIGTFTLASLDLNIVSFRSAKPSSIRAQQHGVEQLSHDVEIDYEQGREQRVTIVTRPVVILFDLQKLDEALSSFGGFSGVLELSSSINSANTISSPVVLTNQVRPRGVHFGETSKTTAQTVTARSNSPKIQVHLGEVAFTLKGRSCAVQLQTTSVRVAVREGNVRLKVTEVKLEGPFTSQSQTGAPLLVDIKGTTLNFLFAPEESDLARLISMITPSKDPYKNNDDILIDTLLRQRKKGSVLRLEIVGVGVRVFDVEELKAFESLGAEMARLSKVTKYLPDDDRPGLLTLASIQQVDASFAINDRLGDISIALHDASAAHVGVPALLALEICKATVKRGNEVLLHELTKLRPQDRLPAIMVRMVGDEMEPIVKAKLFNVCTEYHVATVMAALGLSEDGTGDDIALGIAASVATITGTTSPKTLSRQSSQTSSPSESHRKPLQVDLLLRDCAIGLNPRGLPSKALFVLADAHLGGHQAKQDYSITLELRKASILVVDDIANLEEVIESPRAGTSAVTNGRTLDLQDNGYCLLSSISAAYVYVSMIGSKEEDTQRMDVEFKNELFVLESCADSTQTLIAIINGLQPPTPPSTAERYRPTIPLQQMMESFTGDALLADGPEEEDFMDNADLVEDEVPTNLAFVGSIYNSQSLPTNEELGDSMLGEDDLGAFADSGNIRSIGDRGVLESFQEHYEVADDETEFRFNDNFFMETEADLQGKARKWDSAKNQYHLTNEFKTTKAPLKLRVRDVNIIWNLYDGYDWQRTRDVISQAVDDVEARAEERRNRAREEDEDDDFVEEDFLFNSVWIGVPVKDEKGALARRINHDIDDLASETGSYATSTATRTTTATGRPVSATKSKRRLKLKRSKHKKIAFSLMGVAVDAVVFAPDSGETINSLDVRIRDFEIFDHVPTSTWKKFVTCLIEPSARQVTKPMIELEVVTVKPVTDLAASELVVKVTVLPLRLHVDQDALDFITRFFEFKDDTQPTSTTTSEQPFIQRLEINSVVLKLDYKPKRVDYGGLRSGHTTEFMNFLILDGSDIVLRHAIVYGLTSFDKVHKTLNDVWMPDVQRNQLPGVLSGLAAVRPLVNVGSGVRDLVVVPMREYRKDGRVVRSLQKGVYAFAKNTTSEVARLGAKVAIGTQNLLEGAETFLAPQTGISPRVAHSDWDGEDPSGSSPDEARAVSHYANQPLGVKAGLRSAARHLERDLLTARDAVIAIPAEVMEQGSGVGVAKALARHAPTVILRPALGATKALSNALLGVGNALDEGSKRKVEDKYKSY